MSFGKQPRVFVMANVSVGGHCSKYFPGSHKTAELCTVALRATILSPVVLCSTRTHQLTSADNVVAVTIVTGI